VAISECLARHFFAEAGRQSVVIVEPRVVVARRGEINQAIERPRDFRECAEMKIMGRSLDIDPLGIESVSS